VFSAEKGRRREVKREKIEPEREEAMRDD